MANSVSASFPEFWSRMMQMNHLKKAVYLPLVSRREEATLKKGDTVHRPYRSALVVNDMGSEGSFTRQDITDTDESLLINKEKEVSFYIRSLDEIQSNYATRSEYASDASTQLSNQIDADVLGEALNAASNIDDGDIGGTDGNGIVLSTSNILKVLAKIGQRMNEQNVAMDGRYGVMSPLFDNILVQYLAGKDTAGGDSYGVNGFVRRYYNFDLYMSNNLLWEGVLSMAAQPTDSDTVVIGGVTFTFKTTLGSTPGNVLIGGSADAARANLAALINTPGTTTANGVALSAANQKLMKNFTATNDDTANTLTIYGYGKSDVTVSETFTDATDAWTKQLQHNLFGRKGAIELVIQKQPTTEIFHRDGYIGYDVVSWTAYGKKTFTENAKELVDVRIDVSNVS